MDSSVIILDSDSEDVPVTKTPQKMEMDEPAKMTAAKRTAPDEANCNDKPTKIRRIQPTKIGEIEKKSSAELEGDEPEVEEGFSKESYEPKKENGKEAEEQAEEADPEAGPSNPKKEDLNKNEFTLELRNLINACRSAEPSKEMKKVIQSKLLKYYHSVHPEYVTSKMFLVTLKTVTEEIVREPHLVYAKLKVIIEELDVRRKSKAPAVPSNTSADTVDVESTGDKDKDVHLKKLLKALVKLKRHITDLEEQEVDWEEDDNSAYLKKIRFEKRACQIYQKICEITGESTHAHRIVKKPITFKGTNYKEFNKKLQILVNSKKNNFPNYMDVLKCLDLCNKRHKFELSGDEMKRVAEDAFRALGKKLQERRRTDLYESTTYYVGITKDPAKEDPELRSQLEKNKKFYARYDEVINEYAEKEKNALSDDAEEVVSSTSKTEQPEAAEESKDTEIEGSVPELEVSTQDPAKPNTKCDKNGATSLDEDDDDIMIVS